MIIDVIISHGASLATTTRVALENAQLKQRQTGVRWGEIRWDVWPDDTIEVAIKRFHRAARERREQRGREAEEESDV